MIPKNFEQQSPNDEREMLLGLSLKGYLGDESWKNAGVEPQQGGAPLGGFYPVGPYAGPIQQMFSGYWPTPAGGRQAQKDYETAQHLARFKQWVDAMQKRQK